LRDIAGSAVPEREPTSELLIRNVSRRLGPEKTQQLLEEYDAGAESTELMLRFGLSKSSVLQILHKNGAVLRRQAMPDIHIAKARTLYEVEQRSLAAIATTLGFPRETIRVALIEAGVQMRGRGRRPARH
jgi:AraC-like DNA-binding protein